MTNKKTIFKSLFFIIILISASFFVVCEKNNRKEMDVSLNEAYTDYKNNPERFKVTKAEIVDEYDIGTGQIPPSKGWVVRIDFETQKSVLAVVMRDRNEKIGDVIDVAIKIIDQKEYFGLDDPYSCNTLATQLKYVEETNYMIAYNVIIGVMILLILVIIGRILYLCFKMKED